MIIMVILSVITLGFSQLMAREQRQALDRQLSTQAFYAAESGVNDVDNILSSNPAAISTYSANTCSAASDVGDAALGIRSTCILFDGEVPNLEYSNIPTGPFSPRVIRMNTTTGTIENIQITFSGVAPTSFRGTSIEFPPLPEWGSSTGVMKMFIVPFVNGMSRDALLRSTAYVQLYPTTDASGVSSITLASIRDASTSNYGRAVPVTCSGTSCSITITGVNSSTAYTSLYVAVTNEYVSNSLTLDATDNLGNSLNFIGEQVIVDSTARTSDVVRRIQVRLPANDALETPAAALVSTDPAGGICKIIRASFSGTTSDPNCPF